MCNRLLLKLLFYGSFLICLNAHAQENSAALSLPGKLFKAIDKKAAGISDKLESQTAKYLDRLASKEVRLKKKIWKKDSVLAKQLFPDIDGQYALLKHSTSVVGKYEQKYIGHLDSLSTTFSFLKSSDKLIAQSAELQKSLSSLKNLQSGFNSADAIKKYLKERKQLLGEQLQKLGMLGELRSFKKELYYYAAQVQEYKQLFEDPSKMEEKILTVAMQSEAFKDFFAQNSMLGSLFALPGSNTGASSASLAGLQTRAAVNQILTDRFGSGSSATQYLQQNLQAAQGQLAVLKEKAAAFSSGSVGGASDGELPDFKPNSQRTKSFLQRLELGTNLQSNIRLSSNLNKINCRLLRKQSLCNKFKRPVGN